MSWMLGIPPMDRTMARIVLSLFLLGFAGLIVAAVFEFGAQSGRLAEQRERLTERGCEQIAREPELWECEGGERVEVKP